VAIIDGPGAVTKHQVLSSVACSILGTVLITLLIASFLVWFGLTYWMVVLMLCLMAVVLYVNVQRVRKTVSIIFRLNKQREEFQADDAFTAWFFNTEYEQASPTQKLDPHIEDPDDEEKITEEVVDKEKKGPSHVFQKPLDRRRQLEKNASTYIEGPSIGLYLVSTSIRVTEASEMACWIMMILCVINLKLTVFDLTFKTSYFMTPL
jgi:hypothetical protein